MRLLRLIVAPSLWLLVAGVALSAVAAYFQHSQIEKSARDEFERMSARTELEVARRFEGVVHGVRGARGLFAASQRVERKEFQRYVLSRDVGNEYPGVRGFGFIQRVERSDLTAFVASERADFAPQFAIRQLADKGQADLFVIKYIEPAVNNNGAQGLDVGSEPLRRAGIRQAINTGAPTVTGAITLVQDAKKLPGVLLYLPVYRNGLPTDNPVQRNAALMGVLYAPIVIAEILEGIADVRSGLLDFEIVDTPIHSPNSGALLFDADGHTTAQAAGADPASARRYALRKPLQLPGRSVTLAMSSTPVFDASVDRATPWILFGGGVLVSSLLALVLGQQSSGRRRAEKLAQSMTQDLQAAVRDNEALLSTFNLHSIVSVSDRAGRITEVNDAFTESSGYSREQLLGQDHRIVNSATHPKEFWIDMWKTITSGLPWRGQVCNQARDGSLYWVDTLIAPFIGNDGQIEKYISIRTDITAIKKAEETLRWSQSLLEKMSSASPMGFLVVDNRSDEILYFNQRFCEIWGIGHLAGRMQRKELKNNDIIPDCLAVLADVPAFAASCEPLQSEENRITLEDEIAFTEGRTVRRFTTQIRDADDQYYGRFYIFEDITGRKNSERALIAATQEAQAASRSKGQFLANMSHEIRTPMNAILGMLNLLQSTELTPRQRDYASKTQGAAQSLLGLLNDILDFSKVDAGKMTLESEPFRIDQLLRNLSVVLAANVGTKDIEVLFDIDPALPHVLRGDAMRLQQVLINLGGNAVKFTSHGQVVLALRALPSSPGVARIEFAIQDSGIGIAPENQAHIFSGFSQAEGSTTRLFGGTGLGLAISKRFVELMGGDIQITSTLGQGSRFSFAVDFSLVDEVPADLASNQRTIPAPQRVLVIDDNPIAGDLMLRMVDAWGWPVELANSGARAMDMIRAAYDPVVQQFPYPVIFVDWQMPEMDGWETSHQIQNFVRQNQLQPPTIVMVTAHGRETLAQRSEEEQDMLKGFLVKPVTGSMLFDALMDAGAGSSGLRQLAKGRSSLRQLQGMRILVVEDNLINQQVADELLSAQGAIVSLAANGRLGVDAVAAAAPQFDVVLMDIQMPVLDGYGATRVIRDELRLKQLPIIAMTANAMASDREACLAGGMDEHIGKPFDMAKLVSLLIRITGLEVTKTMAEHPEALLSSHTQALPLPEIPGLDLVTAVGRMSGMRSLYLRTARDFFSALNALVPQLHQHLLAGDKSQALMCLHTLKGNAGTLGATELANKAAELELLYKANGPTEDCVKGLNALEGLVATTQQQLERAIALLQPTAVAPLSEASGEPVDATAVLAALREIDALAAASDMEVLQRFAELREFLSGLPDGFDERLGEVLQNLDLDAAHVLCSEKIDFYQNQKDVPSSQ